MGGIVKLGNLKHLLLELVDNDWASPISMPPALGKGTNIESRPSKLISKILKLPRVLVNKLCSKEGLKLQFRCVVGSSLSPVKLISDGAIEQ